MQIRTKILSILAIVLVVGIVLALSGCVTGSQVAGNTSSNSTVQSNENDTLRVGEMWDITTLDPAAGGGTTIGEKADITETLVGANPDFSLKPELATSWYQVDNLTWVFNLRNDVYFQDGTKMTADDVKWSLDRVISLDPVVTNLVNLDNITVINDTAIMIKTKSENLMLPAVLNYPDTGIIAKSSLDANGNFSKPVGTGAYKFESFGQTTHVLTVVKNDLWWNGTPGLDTLVLTPITDPNTRAMAIESGEIDFTCDVPYNEVPGIAQMPGYTVEKYNKARMYMLVLNLNESSLGDLKVRQAISDAIDRQAIAQNVLYGMGSPAAGPFMSTMAWTNTSLTPYTINLTDANALLDEDGWVNGTDGIREKNGQKLSFTLLTFPNRPGLPPMAEAIAAELKDIGVSVQVQVETSGAISAQVSTGVWDMELTTYATAMVPDPGYILKELYTTNGTYNSGKYSNPQLDALIANASDTKDLNERYQLYEEAQSIVYEQQPIILVDYYGSDIVMKNYVKGFVNDPTSHDYNINPEIYIQN